MHNNSDGRSICTPAVRQKNSIKVNCVCYTKIRIGQIFAHFFTAFYTKYTHIPRLLCHKDTSLQLNLKIKPAFSE